jgi:hypothetical protein
MIAKKPSSRPKLRGHRAITQFSGVDAVLLAQIRNGFAFDQMLAQDGDLCSGLKKRRLLSFIEACSFRPRIA